MEPGAPREGQVAEISGAFRSSSGAVRLKPATLCAHFWPEKEREERPTQKLINS